MIGPGDRFASKAPPRPRFTTHVGRALRVGVVGGFVLGCGEALRTLRANAAIQPGQYFWVYLSVPILAWMALGALLMLLSGAAVAAARRSGEPLVRQCQEITFTLCGDG